MDIKELIIFDTNVPIVANNSGRYSDNCVNACLEITQQILKGRPFAIDNHWLILKEYIANLQTPLKNCISDSLLTWILTNHTNPEICVSVSISPSGPDQCEIAEFPTSSRLVRFDRKDRKFVAVANAHGSLPPIFQATDSKWWKYRIELERLGIKVNFLCEKDILNILKKKKKLRES
jgi:hypothetical protein